MAFQSVDPEIWKPQSDNAELVGWLMSVTPESGKYKGTAYNLEELGSHKKWVVFGNNVLDDKMSFAKVGQLVKIIYLGKKEGNNGQKYNDYKVFIDDGKEEAATDVQKQDQPTVQTVVV